MRFVAVVPNSGVTSNGRKRQAVDNSRHVVPRIRSDRVTRHSSKALRRFGQPGGGPPPYESPTILPRVAMNIDESRVFRQGTSASGDSNDLSIPILRTICHLCCCLNKQRWAYNFPRGRTT